MITGLRDCGDRNANTGRLLMLGFAVPDEVMERIHRADGTPQYQTQKLSWAIVRGVEASGTPVDLLSSPPISDYPKGKWLYSAYRRWDRGNGTDNRLIPFVNLLGWKHVTRFIGCLVLLICWAIRNRRSRRHVVVYGLHSAHLCALLCARRFFQIKCTVIVTDLPGQVIESEHWWRRMVRPLDRWMIHTSVRSMNGLIALTRQIASDYAPTVPALVMEGIVSTETEALAADISKTIRCPQRHHFIVMYAGSLGRAYGVGVLLEAFAMLPGPEYRLWLFGGGNMEDDIRAAAERDTRIEFAGYVLPEVVFRRSCEASILVNPRPSRQEFTPYSFPSKLLEYMASGTPVLTTRLPGIPEEYDPYLLWLDEETPASLAAQLSHLRAVSRQELERRGRYAQDFVLREKNYLRQGSRILRFIQQIDER